MARIATVQLKCPNGHRSFITHTRNEQVDEDVKHCEKCGELMEIIPFKDIQDPDVLLDWADGALENANYHGQVGMPRAVYVAVLPFIGPGHRAWVARVIAETIVNHM